MRVYVYVCVNAYMRMCAGMCVRMSIQYITTILPMFGIHVSRICPCMYAIRNDTFVTMISLLTLFV